MLPCTAFSLALDPTSSNLYAGGSDGRVHVASLNSAGTSTVATTTSHAASDSSTNATARVAVANG